MALAKYLTPSEALDLKASGSVFTPGGESIAKNHTSGTSGKKNGPCTGWMPLSGLASASARLRGSP